MSTDKVSAGSGTILCARGLVVGHAGKALLPPLDIELKAGTVTAVLGRNGAGKSTLLKTLLGVLPPIAGVLQKRRSPLRVALMPQTRDLDFQLPITVREFVSWGKLTGQGFLRRAWSTRDERAAVDRALAELGLEDLGGRFLRELSEGQQQRVLFARVLASEADLALLDEPTAAMDAVFQGEVMARLHLMARERSMAVLVVTHALTMLSENTDAIVFLDAEAQAVSVGPREEVLQSEAFLRRFQGIGGLGPLGVMSGPASSPVPAAGESLAGSGDSSRERAVAGPAALTSFASTFGEEVRHG